MDDNNQIYVIIESDILKNKNISNTSKICYAYIQYFSNNKNGYCYLTRKKLANIMNIKLRRLYEIINSLIKYNYITIIKKNNRSYIMPTINQAIHRRQIETKNNNNYLNQFCYDWLNEEE